ncbi:MAG: hypothetical protein JF616_03025 [Fibrobacteres bacterium]|nr:hypothetical protein [Fibrobacterota bacterium]
MPSNPALGLLFLGVLAAFPVAAKPNQKLADLPADTWYTVQNSQMSKYCPTPYVGGTNGCKAIVQSWNGGLFIPDTKSMLVWGGGHGDYYGNEVYAFSIDSLGWTLLTQPSRTSPLIDQDPLPDGNPVARHTYDDLAYIGHAKKMFAYGGSRAGNGYATTVTWTLDIASKAWKNMAPPGTTPQGACCNMSSDYDPVSKMVLFRDPYSVFSYDYDGNKWSKLLDWSHSWGPQKGVVVPARRLYFTIGSGEFLVYDIAAKKDVSASWKTTGGDSIIAGYGPGMAYDSKTDKLVAWNGGGVYALDLTTKAWTRMSSTGAPPAQSQYGTYGRFRYVPEENVFILVNDIEQNVSFYKLSAGPGTSNGVRIPHPAAPGTGMQKLILEPGRPGQWPALTIPLDGSRSRVDVGIYDTRGRLQTRFGDVRAAGRLMLSLPGGKGVYLVEAHASGKTFFRAMLTSG